MENKRFKLLRQLRGKIQALEYQLKNTKNSNNWRKKDSLRRDIDLKQAQLSNLIRISNRNKRPPTNKTKDVERWANSGDVQPITVPASWPSQKKLALAKQKFAKAAKNNPGPKKRRDVPFIKDPETDYDKTQGIHAE